MTRVMVYKIDGSHYTTKDFASLDLAVSWIDEFLGWRIINSEDASEFVFKIITLEKNESGTSNK